MNKTKKQKMVIVIVLMFVLIILIAVIVNRIDRLEIKIQSEVGEQNMETILKGGYEIEVISLNLDKDVNMDGRGEMDEWYSKVHKQPPKPMKEMVKESLAEGKKWDIIGFQEMIEGHRGDVYDTALFIQMMKELVPERTYQCVTQKTNSDGFAAAICSHYPFIADSFREEIIFTSSNLVQNRVIICVIVQTPAGDMPVCSTHPRAGSDPPSQFRNMENIVFEKILPSYVPVTVPADKRDLYIASLKARMILTGDMNYKPNGSERFSSISCMRKWPGMETTKEMGGCGIDHVMIVNMADVRFGHAEPFNRLYLTPLGSYGDMTRPWPTDHLGPVFSLISTQELKIPVKYMGDVSPTPKVIPSVTVSISPVVSPTPEIIPLSLNVITFNIGAFTISQDYYDVRIDPIVKYLGKGNYDIIALQETSYGRKEGERIAARLEELGYGKYYTSKVDDPKSDADAIRHGVGVYVLSRYPVSTVYSRYGIGRSVLSEVNHPQLGALYIASVHPSNDSRCEQPREILNKVVNEPKKIRDNLILMGDMNSYLVDLKKKPMFKAFKGDMCGEEKLLENFDFSCVNFKECLDEGAIDWIFTQKSSVFSIESRNYHTNVYGELGIPGNNWQMHIHKPVSAKIIVNKPLIVTPLPPIVTPTPFISENLSIDLNLDGKIDITDFALFVEYYGVGDNKIDFDRDGKSKRDIDDLSYFIQEYKKEKIDGND